MKFNFDINKLITIGGIGLSAIGAFLSSIANDKKRRLNSLFFFIFERSTKDEQRSYCKHCYGH